ncbi:DUF4870 domain-containing protein [Actinomycetota bacterium]
MTSQPQDYRPQTPPASPQTPYSPPSQPAEGINGYFGSSAQLTVQQERNVALAAHAISLALVVTTAGLFAWLAPVAMWALFKDRGPFARHHVTEALNFTIAVGIGLAISGLLMFVLIGFVTYPIIWVAAIVMHIIALTRTHRGEFYRYPMTPKFVS